MLEQLLTYLSTDHDVRPATDLSTDCDVRPATDLPDHVARPATDLPEHGTNYDEMLRHERCVEHERGVAEHAGEEGAQASVLVVHALTQPEAV